MLNMPFPLLMFSDITRFFVNKLRSFVFGYIKKGNGRIIDRLKIWPDILFARNRSLFLRCSHRTWWAMTNFNFCQCLYYLPMRSATRRPKAMYISFPVDGSRNISAQCFLCFFVSWKNESGFQPVKGRQHTVAFVLGMLHLQYHILH